MQNCPSGVPAVVFSAFESVLSNHIEEQDIFSRPGGLHPLLRTRYNEHSPGLDLRDVNGHVCATLIKMYLRDMQPAVFDPAMYTKVASTALLPENERVNAFHDLFIKQSNLSQLPLIKYIFSCLRVVALHSDINQMRPVSLAKIFSPLMLRPLSKKDEVENKIMNAAVSTMILHADKIFNDNSVDDIEYLLHDCKKNCDGFELHRLRITQGRLLHYLPNGKILGSIKFEDIEHISVNNDDGSFSIVLEPSTIRLHPSPWDCYTKTREAVIKDIVKSAAKLGIAISVKRASDITSESPPPISKFVNNNSNKQKDAKLTKRNASKDKDDTYGEIDVSDGPFLDAESFASDTDDKMIDDKSHDIKRKERQMMRTRLDNALNNIQSVATSINNDLRDDMDDQNNIGSSHRIEPPLNNIHDPIHPKKITDIRSKVVDDDDYGDDGPFSEHDIENNESVPTTNSSHSDHKCPDVNEYIEGLREANVRADALSKKVQILQRDNALLNLDITTLKTNLDESRQSLINSENEKNKLLKLNNDYQQQIVNYKKIVNNNKNENDDMNNDIEDLKKAALALEESNRLCSELKQRVVDARKEKNKLLDDISASKEEIAIAETNANKILTDLSRALSEKAEYQRKYDGAQQKLANQLPSESSSVEKALPGDSLQSNINDTSKYDNLKKENEDLQKLCKSQEDILFTLKQKINELSHDKEKMKRSNDKYQLENESLKNEIVESDKEFDALAAQLKVVEDRLAGLSPNVDEANKSLLLKLETAEKKKIEADKHLLEAENKISDIKQQVRDENKQRLLLKEEVQRLKDDETFSETALKSIEEKLKLKEMECQKLTMELGKALQGKDALVMEHEAAQNILSNESMNKSINTPQSNQKEIEIENISENRRQRRDSLIKNDDNDTLNAARREVLELQQQCAASTAKLQVAEQLIEKYRKDAETESSNAREARKPVSDDSSQVDKLNNVIKPQELKLQMYEKQLKSISDQLEEARVATSNAIARADANAGACRDAKRQVAALSSLTKSSRSLSFDNTTLPTDDAMYLLKRQYLDQLADAERDIDRLETERLELDQKLYKTLDRINELEQSASSTMIEASIASESVKSQNQQLNWRLEILQNEVERLVNQCSMLSQSLSESQLKNAGDESRVQILTEECNRLQNMIDITEKRLDDVIDEREKICNDLEQYKKKSNTETSNGMNNISDMSDADRMRQRLSDTIASHKMEREAWKGERDDLLKMVSAAHVEASQVRSELMESKRSAAAALIEFEERDWLREEHVREISLENQQVVAARVVIEDECRKLRDQITKLQTDLTNSKTGIEGNRGLNTSNDDVMNKNIQLQDDLAKLLAENNNLKLQIKIIEADCEVLKTDSQRDHNDRSETNRLRSASVISELSRTSTTMDTLRQQLDATQLELQTTKSRLRQVELQLRQQNIDDDVLMNEKPTMFRDVDKDSLASDGLHDDIINDLSEMCSVLKLEKKSLASDFKEQAIALKEGLQKLASCEQERDQLITELKELKNQSLNRSISRNSSMSTTDRVDSVAPSTVDVEAAVRRMSNAQDLLSQTESELQQQRQRSASIDKLRQNNASKAELINEIERLKSLMNNSNDLSSTPNDEGIQQKIDASLRQVVMYNAENSKLMRRINEQEQSISNLEKQLEEGKRMLGQSQLDLADAQSHEKGLHQDFNIIQDQLNSENIQLETTIKERDNILQELTQVKSENESIKKRINELEKSLDTANHQVVTLQHADDIRRLTLEEDQTKLEPPIESTVCLKCDGTGLDVKVENERDPKSVSALRKVWENRLATATPEERCLLLEEELKALKESRNKAIISHQQLKKKLEEQERLIKGNHLIVSNSSASLFKREKTKPSGNATLQPLPDPMKENKQKDENECEICVSLTAERNEYGKEVDRLQKLVGDLEGALSKQGRLSPLLAGVSSNIASIDMPDVQSMNEYLQRQLDDAEQTMHDMNIEIEMLKSKLRDYDSNGNTSSTNNLGDSNNNNNNNNNNSSSSSSSGNVNDKMDGTMVSALSSPSLRGRDSMHATTASLFSNEKIFIDEINRLREQLNLTEIERDVMTNRMKVERDMKDVAESDVATLRLRVLSLEDQLSAKDRCLESSTEAALESLDMERRKQAPLQNELNLTKSLLQRIENERNDEKNSFELNNKSLNDKIVVATRDCQVACDERDLALADKDAAIASKEEADRYRDKIVRELEGKLLASESRARRAEADVKHQATMAALASKSMGDPHFSDTDDAALRALVHELRLNLAEVSAVKESQEGVLARLRGDIHVLQESLQDGRRALATLSTTSIRERNDLLMQNSKLQQELNGANDVITQLRAKLDVLIRTTTEDSNSKMEQINILENRLVKATRERDRAMTILKDSDAAIVADRNQQMNEIVLSQERASDVDVTVSALERQVERQKQQIHDLSETLSKTIDTSRLKEKHLEDKIIAYQKEISRLNDSLTFAQSEVARLGRFASDCQAWRDAAEKERDSSMTTRDDAIRERDVAISAKLAADRAVEAANNRAMNVIEKSAELQQQLDRYAIDNTGSDGVNASDIEALLNDSNVAPNEPPIESMNRETLVNVVQRCKSIVKKRDKENAQLRQMLFEGDVGGDVASSLPSATTLDENNQLKQLNEKINLLQNQVNAYESHVCPIVSSDPSPLDGEWSEILALVRDAAEESGAINQVAMRNSRDFVVTDEHEADSPNK